MSNAILWTLQIALALMFAAAGSLKLVGTQDRLAEQLGQWIASTPMWQVKLLGLAEVLAAIGLIAPWATDTVSVLTPLAACGVVAVMLGAIVLHLKERDFQQLAMNVAVAAVAIFVAVLRFGS